MSLRFPFVFWNEHEPPTLSFTACVITRDGKRAVTGTNGGICVLWNLNSEHDDDNDGNDGGGGDVVDPQKEHGDSNDNHDYQGAPCTGKLEPFAVLYGHESTVTDMCECVYEHDACVCSISADGTLCVWNLSDGRCMVILPFLLQGSPTSVVSITQNASHRDQSNLLSALSINADHLREEEGEEEELLEEGQNNRVDQFGKQSHGDMVVGTSPCENLVACAGKYNTIEIVDLRQHRVIRVLEGHTEWVRSLTCRADLQDEINNRVTLVSVGDDSSVRYWSLDLSATAASTPSSTNEIDGTETMKQEKKKKKKKEAKILEEESWKAMGNSPSYFSDEQLPLGDIHCFAVNAQTYRPLSVSHSMNTDHIIVVSEWKWMIFAYHSFQPSYVVESRSTKLQGGFFLDQRHVLISTTGGEAYMYRIPDLNASTSPVGNGMTQHNIDRAEQDLIPLVGAPNAFFGGTSLESNALTNAMNSHIAVRPITKDETETEPSSVAASEEHKPKLIRVLGASVKSSHALSSAKWSTEANLIIRADTNGRIKLWGMSSCEERPEELTFVEADTTTLSRGWWIRRTIGHSQHRVITSTHFSVEENQIPLLVHGHVDGQVCIYPSVSSTTSEHQNEPIAIQAHDGRVTTLLVMYDADNDRQLLISGSSDFTVKVWNLDLNMSRAEDVQAEASRRLLTTFYYHSGTVNLIFLPPNSISETFQNSFCSVAEDRSVIMYSAKTLECLHAFGGHQCSVVSVYFRQDLDYLLVRCSDTSVYVWQLSTGLMDRKISGCSAMELIERSEGPGSVRRRDLKITFSKQSAMNHERSKARFLETVSLGVEPHWDYSSRASNVEHRHHCESPDLQILILSVRRMIAFMNRNMRALKEHFSGQKGDATPSTPLDITDEARHVTSSSSSSSTSSTQRSPLSYTLICALAYVLQYGNEDHCPALANLRKQLHINRESMPKLPRSYIGLKGIGNTFSLIVPRASDRSHPFLFSSTLSAQHAISVVSILNCLSSIPQLRPDCHKVIRYYLYDIHNHFKKFVEPNFLWCAQFLKDLSKDIQSGTRQVMTARLSRMEGQQQTKLAEELVNILLQCTETRLKSNITVSLAIFVHKAPNAVDHRIMSIVAHGLMEIVEQGGMHQNTAISLLGEGYSIWRNFLPDEMGFCRTLFHLSLPALTNTHDTNKVMSSGSNDVVTTETNLAIDALQSFVNMTNAAPFIYVEFINSMTSNSQHMIPANLAAVVTSLYPIMKKYPACLVPYIAPISALLIKVLDPHLPQIREACIQTSTLVMRYMVEIYPMACFHQEKQRLAIGNPDGMVVVYDMRTASKWQLFEAHPKSPIAAVSFSPGGEWLVTYSPKSFACKVWTFEGGGVFSLLGMLNRSLKTFKVPASDPTISDDDIVRSVRFEWSGAKHFSLKPARSSNAESYSF